jgi:hypothetical protein
VIGSIVYHNYCARSPLPINAVQVIAQFDQEQHEGIAVVLPTVDGEHELTITAHCSYDTESSQSLHSSSHVSLPSFAPSSLSFIRLIENAFIYIDDSLTFRQKFDVVGCCHLPLQFSLLLIMSRTDRLHLPI